MANRPKDKTHIFMNALVELKSISASVDQARAKAWQLYPGDNPSEKSNRFLFMRVFRAPRAAYDDAVRRWNRKMPTSPRLLTASPESALLDHVQVI